MNKNCSLVITSIASAENKALQKFAQGCHINGIPFIVIGDSSSPDNFFIKNCDFWSLKRQNTLPFEIVKNLPVKNYARKNIGYLLAMSNGSEIIIESDDDNFPKSEFWLDRGRFGIQEIKTPGWINIYQYFTNNDIWPRGFPLEMLQKPKDQKIQKNHSKNPSTIQQSLADKNPDVDAIYRLTHSLPLTFKTRTPISIGFNCWCPINSQNTTWFKEAFPLLYLPSYCSFRMTDIWRGFIAQRIAWNYKWVISFHNASVYQKRNKHNLLIDFQEEIPGYLNNNKIIKDLQNMKLKGSIYNNLILCYKMMIDKGYLDSKEMNLVKAWVRDCINIIQKDKR